MVWVSVTGLPILNRAFTRSAPRSAMRLASSCTVIASGTTTSRTCLVAGPVSMWWRFSFSRARRSAASERARFSSSSERARDLQGSQARFLGLAQELLLKLLAVRHFVLRRRLARLRSRRLGRRHRRGRLGDGLGRFDRRGLARTAEDAPLLDLDDDRVGAA